MLHMCVWDDSLRFAATKLCPSSCMQMQVGSILLHITLDHVFLFLTVHYLHESFSAALCPDPVGIENGTVTFTSNSIGDTATYSCDPGFELIGSAITTCTQVDANSAVFQPVQPFCRREYTE